MKKLQLTDIFETERLVIRMPQVTDARIFNELIDETTTQFMNWDKFSEDSMVEAVIDNNRRDAEKGDAWQGVIELKNGAIIGRIGIHNIDYEACSICLAYWLGKEYFGNGYIPECVELMKKVCFTKLGVNKMIIRFSQGNQASKRVAEKCGFQFEGTMLQDTFEKGKFVDKCYYGFLREDYI